MLTATRPSVSCAIVATCLAASVGFQGPGRIAAITLSLVVAASSAWLKATDSCWYSAPYPAVKRICVSA